MHSFSSSVIVDEYLNNNNFGILRSWRLKIKTYWSSSFWPKVFFVCFVRIIQKLVVELRQTEKKFETKIEKKFKKKIEKKKKFEKTKLKKKKTE